MPALVAAAARIMLRLGAKQITSQIDKSQTEVNGELARNIVYVKVYSGFNHSSQLIDSNIELFENKRDGFPLGGNVRLSFITNLSYLFIC